MREYPRCTTASRGLLRRSADDSDARNIINGRKSIPRRGGRFNPEHDRGLSPEPPGTRVFSREIRTAPFPPRF